MAAAAADDSLEERVGEGAATGREPGVLRVEDVEQLQQSLPGPFPLLTARLPYDVHEPADRVVDVAGQHVEVGDGKLCVEVGGRVGRLAPDALLAGASGADQQLATRERGPRHRGGGGLLGNSAAGRGLRIDVPAVQRRLGLRMGRVAGGWRRGLAGWS